MYPPAPSGLFADDRAQAAALLGNVPFVYGTRFAVRMAYSYQPPCARKPSALGASLYNFNDFNSRVVPEVVHSSELPYVFGQAQAAGGKDAAAVAALSRGMERLWASLTAHGLRGAQMDGGNEAGQREGASESTLQPSAPGTTTRRTRTWFSSSRMPTAASCWSRGGGRSTAISGASSRIQTPAGGDCTCDQRGCAMPSRGGGFEGLVSRGTHIRSCASLLASIEKRRGLWENSPPFLHFLADHF